uniref:Odontosis associated phosphoprotein n=1 Tax=Oryctolagus cuniculus TaxID=9986 RepID=A0A5F9CJL5_RABIT
MACSPSFSWLLVCWLAVTVAEGQEVANPPAVAPTDCQIFTLTPSPTTRAPATRVQLVTRTPRCPFHNFPGRRPGVHLGFPNRPFFPPKCNHRFVFQPFYRPHARLPPNNFPGTRLHSDSSSEESR